MRIEFLRPQGPQPTEMVGLAEFRSKLPGAWKGYANFNMRNPRRRGQDREIDVVLIAPDRLILVDLKHVRGRIESRSGVWFKDDEDIGPSAAHKIRENAKILAELIRREIHQIPGAPPVESAVVFTHDRVDFGGLDATERERCFNLADFTRIANENEFRKLFPTGSSFGDTAPLNNGTYYTALQKLFANVRFIQARRAKYHGFILTGQPEFSHRLYEEFPCQEEADPNYRGLLRLWRFDEDPDTFALEEERRPVAERERTVLGYVLASDPAFYNNYVMRCVAHDREFPLRHSEIFERHIDLARLTRFAGAIPDLDLDRRLELARLFLDRVAGLHRLRVAHRDLDRHSVWVDERRSSIVLSSFGASHFPERKTIGEKRSKISAAGFKVPEDAGVGARGTPFQQDVFLAGAVVWTLLTGERLPEVDGVPLWTSDTIKPERHDLPSALVDWFAATLSLDTGGRPADAVEAAQRFADVVRRSQTVSLERQLDRYRREIDPVADHRVLPDGWIKRKPYRVFRAYRDGGEGDATVLVKSWPEQYLGDRRKAALRLIEFLARAERIEALATPWAPRIRSACLCMDGLLLVQDWSEGHHLGAEATFAWDENETKRFLGALVAAVEELHAAGLAHGDLKPENVLAAFDGSSPAGDARPKVQPVLLDLLDYAPAAAGERTTSAYCPPTGGDDPAIRDRFAVGQIAIELSRRWPDSPAAVGIQAAVERCGSGDEPWATIKPLREALAAKADGGDREEAGTFDLAVDVRSPPFEGALLADNDHFHVVAEPDLSRVEVYGFDQKVSMELDRADGRAKKAFVKAVDAREAGWAFRHRSFSFSGEVRIGHAANLRYSGLDPLLAHLRERMPADRPEGWSAPSGGTTAIGSDGTLLSERPPVAGTDAPVAAPDPRSAGMAPSGGAVDQLQVRDGKEAAKLPGLASPMPASTRPWRFPVVRFWRETIAVEEEIQPEILLTEPPQETLEAGVVVLRIKEAIGISLEGAERGDGPHGISATMNGDKIGDVDAGRTTGGIVTLRNARNYRRLRAGDRLRILSSGDVQSFQRRSRALARVLQGRGQLPALVSYFDPAAQLDLQTMADPIPDGALDRYELNEEQTSAFAHLWEHGPVGLLQGPPGTGKTRFIAAFVHWALNEGRMRNVLVLSQSHEAVNEVADRILDVADRLGGGIDLLRVGEHDKISPRLRRYHSQAVQDRYRELFHAEMRDRIAVPARRLGLDMGFVREAFEVEAAYGPLIRQMALARRDIEHDSDEDSVNGARTRLRSLHATFERRLSAETTQPEEGSPEEVFEELHDDVAHRHRVFDPDARRRLSRLHDLGREWTSALRGRGRTLEEFLARSRNLVCGTCVGIGRQGLRIDQSAFDLVVIDEAARCTPSELAVGMQSAKRVLLVGDHRQLPPLYGHELLGAVAERMKAPSRKMLGQSDFERAFGSRYGKAVSRTLVRQYRMASEIHALVTSSFYPTEGLIKARGEPLDIYRLLPEPLNEQVLWLDTGGEGGREAEAGTSFTNRREALVIVETLRRLGRCRQFFDRIGELKLEEGRPLVGVICTYAQQAELLKALVVASDLPARLKDLVRIDTVDAYQGKENHIVILSLVRSNFERDMGHVRSRNRINVALSRAMDRLMIVGAARMFEGGGSSLRKAVKDLRAANRIRSASRLVGR